MIRKFLIGASAALALTTGTAMAENAVHIEDYPFSFEGPFGTFDQFQLQRGLQVYTEVLLGLPRAEVRPIRTLSDPGGPGLPEDQVRAYAAAFPVNDEASNPQLIDPATGSVRRWSRLTSSGAQRLRAARAGPVDDGQGPGGLPRPLWQWHQPAVQGHRRAGVHPCAADRLCGSAGMWRRFETGYYNKAFAKGAIPDACKDEHGHATIEGSWIAMPPPLSDDQVTYADGHAATVDNMSATLRPS